MSKASPARVAAVRALVASEGGAHVDQVLAEAQLRDPRDQGLAMHLSLGVLRRRGALDQVLERFMKRSMSQVDAVPGACLRMGLFEAKFSRTPAPTAVDQAIEVCRRLRMARATGFVNAVLRKAIRQELPDDPMLDLPQWLRERWDGWQDWVGRLRDPAPLCIALMPGIDPSADAGPAMAAGEAVNGASLLPGAGRIEEISGFDEGHFWVMDPAALRVAQLVAANTPEGGTVLDACAAPGGKTLALASRGFQVTAVDASEQRLVRLRENLTRLALTAEVRCHDWEAGALDETYDMVFVDAPCTGLGTVRRHPEIRWRVAPSDPAAMAIRQERILRSAMQSATDVVVYAVCSPMEEEGIGVVERIQGWKVVDSFHSCPPSGDEDAHQAFVLRRS